MKELGKELEILARWEGRWRVRGGFGTGDCGRECSMSYADGVGCLCWV